jgi:hypothetical protein
MATIPTPKTWAAGLWSAADMNIHMRDTLEFFLNPPLCVVRKDESPITIPRFGQAPISWDSAVIDNDGCFNTSSNTRLTANTPGYYVFVLQLQWWRDGGADDSRFHYLVRYNSAGVQQENGFPHMSNRKRGDESYTQSVVFAMNAGDYVVASYRKWVEEDQIVQYSPPDGRYGNQLDMRWISAL